MFTEDYRRALEQLQTLSAELSTPLFLVGGIVRDLVQGKPFHDNDIDLLVEGDAIAFAARAAGVLEGELTTFPKFLTAKIRALKKIPHVAEIDLASTRAEDYPTPGALPVVRPTSLKEDLQRRDFSVNALAVSLSDFINWLRRGGTPSDLRGVVIDRHNGLADLDSRLVRILHPQSFVDDPTRIFRGARYAGRWQVQLETDTMMAARRAVEEGAMETISDFRKLTELRKIWEEEDPLPAMIVIEGVGAFDALRMVPPLMKTRFVHCYERLAQLAMIDTTLRFEALFALAYSLHDEGEREPFARRFGYGRSRIATLEREIQAAQSAKLPSEISTLSIVLRSISDGPQSLQALEELQRNRTHKGDRK